MEELLKEVVTTLEVRNIRITTEGMKHLLVQWIENLYSHIGIDAHDHTEACGVENETDMSLDELDAYMVQQITIYEDALKALENNDEKYVKVKGFYISQWDDGIEIVSNAEINLATQEVIIGYHYYDYDLDNMDLEVLDREYIKFSGIECPCCRKEEAHLGDFWYK